MTIGVALQQLAMYAGLRQITVRKARHTHDLVILHLCIVLEVVVHDG